MARGLPDLGRFSTVPASLPLLIMSDIVDLGCCNTLAMSDIVDLGCCNTLAMSDIFSPFLNRSTASSVISLSLLTPWSLAGKNHTHIRSRRLCHVCSDLTTHYFIYRNKYVVIFKQNRRFFDGNFYFPYYLRHIGRILLATHCTCAISGSHH